MAFGIDFTKADKKAEQSKEKLSAILASKNKNKTKPEKKTDKQHWLSLLTPTQYAELFPQYYKKQLPDIGKSVLGGAARYGSKQAIPAGSKYSMPPRFSGGGYVSNKGETKDQGAENLRKALEAEGIKVPENVTSKSLADMRSKLSSALKNNKDSMDKILAMTMAEVGGQSKLDKTKFLETVFNRALATGKETVDGIIDNTSYYAPHKNGKFQYYYDLIKSGKLDKKTQSLILDVQSSLNEVISGSNITRGNMHNASAGVADAVRKGGYDADIKTIHEVATESGKSPETTYTKTFVYEQEMMNEINSRYDADMAKLAEERTKAGGIKESLPTEAFVDGEKVLTSSERTDIFEKGGVVVNLDTNWAEKENQQTTPMVVIPDNATKQQRHAAEEYANRVAKAYEEKFGKSLKPKVLTRSENGRGRAGTIHTEPFAATDTKAVEYFINSKEGRAKLAEITKETLGKLPGVKFSLPHDEASGDKGAVGPHGSEVDLAKKLMEDLKAPSERIDPPEGVNDNFKKFWNKLTNTQKKAIQEQVTSMGAERLNQIADTSYAEQKDVVSYSPAESTGIKFNIKGGTIEGIDPKLVNVMKEASKDLPENWQVSMISGKDARSTGTKNHPGGIAMDVQIYDADGKLMPYDRNSPGWKHYEKLYRSVVIRGKEMYPEEEFIWGGAWQSKAAGDGDPMHYQIVNKKIPFSSRSSGAYSFEKGLNPSHQFARETPENQLSKEEREAWDKRVKENIIKEKADVLTRERIKEESTGSIAITPLISNKAKEGAVTTGPSPAEQKTPLQPIAPAPLIKESPPTQKQEPVLQEQPKAPELRQPTSPVSPSGNLQPEKQTEHAPLTPSASRAVDNTKVSERSRPGDGNKSI